MVAEAQLQAALNGRAFEGLTMAETPRLAREAEALAGELRASLARPAAGAAR
jgi:hypothetical protein